MLTLARRVCLRRAGNLNPQTGAPNRIDRAWAIFIGGDANCGL